MDFFATRIHRARMHNGVIRIEFCTIEPDESGNLTPQTPVRPENIKFSVCIPVASLARSIGELRQLYMDLIEKGVLRKPEEGGGGERRRMSGGRAPSDSDNSPLV